jgi:PIN domain nuclease of toxin-antitoxin system
MLLDTHVVLWMLSDDPKLGPEARSAISDELDILVSTACLWEMAIKQSSGKLTLPEDVISRVESAGASWLDISADHAWGVSEIEGLAHSDPFDRVLIAAAASENMALMTADRKLLAYTGTPKIRLLDAKL